MNFENVLGNEPIKNFLLQGIAHNRIPHAQLFVGAEGTGMLPMAIAYATELICMSDAPYDRHKCNELLHPDMHFVFPTSTTTTVKENPESRLFIEQWRTFIQQSPYGTVFDWLSFLGIEKKQATINVREAKSITDSLSLKSFDGGYKVMIIWQADKMNVECSNKLLKILEEPPKQTVFILITENPSELLDTITSRCQITKFNPLPEATIVQGLQKMGISEATASYIAHKSHGSFQKALHYATDNTLEESFEARFVSWVRTAFSAKKNPSAINGLLAWSEELSRCGREEQLQFLSYCIDVFRQAMLLNFSANELVYMSFTTDFKLERFAPFVHHNNINAIFEELEKASFHIERNGASKTIFTDLSIKLTRLLHAQQ